MFKQKGQFIWHYLLPTSVADIRMCLQNWSNIVYQKLLSPNNGANQVIDKGRTMSRFIYESNSAMK